MIFFHVHTYNHLLPCFYFHYSTDKVFFFYYFQRCVPRGYYSLVMGLYHQVVTHPCMHASIHPCIHPCMHASMHASIHACIHSCMHPFMHAPIHALNTVADALCISKSAHEINMKECNKNTNIVIVAEIFDATSLRKNLI